MDKHIIISDGERLIVLMLCDLFKHLKYTGSIDYEFIKDALENGHDWSLAWKYAGFANDTLNDEKTVTEVVDVLRMWSFIEAAYARLLHPDKGRVDKAVGQPIVFLGFDGTNEGDHLGIAHFLVKKMGRFEEFKDRGLNAHMQMLDTYRPMVQAFKAMNLSLHDVTCDSIIELFNAGRSRKESAKL